MSCVQFSDVPRFASWLIYFILLLCRFIIVIHVQSGYLHPDEFFQSLEVAAGDIYNLRVFRPWEFSVSDDGGPLRSIAGISPMVHLPIRIYKGLYADSALHIPSSGGINSTLPYTGAELLNRIVLPTRLFTTFCSLIVDVFILYSCAILRKPNRPGRRCFLSISPPVSLILYASAVFGGLLYSTRTLANTWELTSVSAFGLLFTLIIRSCQLPVLSKWVLIRVAFFMLTQAVLSMWSIFVRTTYPLFILPMAVIEICVIMHHFGLWFSFWISSACVLVASFVAYVCLLVDTIYYSIPNWFGEWLDLSDMVCVPCRFIAYNKVSENVVTHGYHPYHFHFLVNLPQMVGPVIILLALWPPGRRNLMSYVLWMGCVLPIMILSCVPHQEARFLLPIIPQLLLLAGHRLESSIKTHRASLIYSIWKSKLGLLLTIFWVLHQLVLLIFYANLHQGGLVKFYSTLAPANDRSCSTNVFYRTYMPPRFPFGTLADKNDAMGTGCHEVLDVQDLNQLNSAMDQHAVTSRPVINLIYPGSLSPPINGYNFGPVREHRSIFGHLSTEDWPHLFSNASTSVTDFLNNLRSQLSLHIFSICTDEKQCIV